MTQRWSQVSAAAHSPKSSEPEPFTVFYAEDAGVDVGKLDDSGASGFLAGIENSTINGVVSPRFVPASEAAANTFFLDSWDNHNETLGAVVFSKADSTGLDVKILVNDTVTQPNSAGSFSSTHLLPLNDMLTNAWLQTVSPALSYVSHSTADYPREEDEAAVDYTALSLVEPLGMALHMALPSILVGLAADISLGMRRHLSILGVRRTVYWTVNYGVAFCVMCIPLTPIIISGLAFDIRFFTLNNFFLYFVLFVAFAANLASTAMMIAPLLRNVHVAVIVGTVVAIVLNESACIVSYLSDQFSSTELIPLVLPSASLQAALKILADVSTVGHNGAYLTTVGWPFWSFVLMIIGTTPVQLCIGFIIDWKLSELVTTAFFYASKGFNRVLTVSFGLRSLVFVFRFITHRIDPRVVEEEATPAAIRTRRRSLVPGALLPHPSVQQQRMQAEAMPDDADGIVVKHISKRFRQQFGQTIQALDDVSFVIPRGSTLALAGPAGAGVSTLINVLTSQVKPKGTATVAGSKANGSRAVYRSIGVCTQQDYLWPMLTVGEHLAFVGRIKGLVGGDLADGISEVLNILDMHAIRNSATSTLTPAQKRVVMVALAILGDPPVLLLDQPTFGVDPVTRQRIWQYIAQSNGISTILLASSSMEEIEVCGKSVAFLVGGKLKCMAPTEDLKRHYGLGYKLVVTGPERTGETDLIADVVQSALPSAVLTGSTYGTRLFTVPTHTAELADIFDEMEAVQLESEVDDWGVSHSGLGDVYSLITAAEGSV